MAGSHTCACKNGWKGTNCGQPTGCDDNPCKHGADCTATGGRHTCTCKDGWKNDQTCNDPTGCDGNPCGAHGDQCTATGGRHTCTCKDGWKNDQTCNEPTGCDGNPCGAHGDQCTAMGGRYTCTCKGGWGDDQTCNTCAHPCAAAKPDRARNAQHACPAGSCYQASCSATCRAGYEGSRATYTCNLQGSWESSAPLICTAVPCSDTPPTPNAASCAAGQYEGPPCPVVCNPGYQPSDRPSAPATCGSDGSWQGGSTCSPVSCGTIEQVDSTGCGRKYHYEDDKKACTATCDTGFTLTGVAGGVASTDFYCGTDKQFKDSAGGETIPAKMDCQRECCTAVTLP
jgi:hypothetical protein